MKQEVIVFTVADKANEPYAEMLEKSFKHFHPDVRFHCVKGEELFEYTSQDPQFYYRQKPIIARRFIEEYECVIGMDADSIVLGDMSYIWKKKDYDVGTVLNYNRNDAQQYGFVTIQGIDPVQYFNCGLVALRSKEFIDLWGVKCHMPMFDRVQYREQDILNLMLYYGNFQWRCFDYPDKSESMQSWWGLIAKSDWNRAILKDGKVIIPKGENNMPPVNMDLKVVHWAGGKEGSKMNYKTRFPDEVSEFIDGILK